MDRTARQVVAPLDTLAPLADPVRRRLYAFVARQAGAVDRDTAAQALGIGRPLAAFHLDRLAAADLLSVEYRRRSGRSGPGAGRPAKFYRRRTGPDVVVSLPPRSYDLAAEILAEGAEGRPEATDRVLEAARRRGVGLAGATTSDHGRGALLDLLEDTGYEPQEEADGAVLLRNCPFHALVQDHRALTCSMNLALLDALCTTLGDADLRAEPRPEDGYCCVAFVPAGRKDPAADS